MKCMVKGCTCTWIDSLGLIRGTLYLQSPVWRDYSNLEGNGSKANHEQCCPRLIHLSITDFIMCRLLYRVIWFQIFLITVVMENLHFLFTKPEILQFRAMNGTITFGKFACVSICIISKISEPAGPEDHAVTTTWILIPWQIEQNMCLRLLLLQIYKYN